MKKRCLFFTLLLCTGLVTYAGGGKEAEAAAAEEGPLVMNMFIPLGARQQSMEAGKNPYTDYLQDKFNVIFDLVVVPMAARAEKQSLLLASGDYPDIFFNSSFSPSDQMKYGGLGIFIPLNDLIDKYGPAIQEVWEILPVLKRWMVTPDGNIYTIPAVEECYHCSVNQKHWIRTPWLEKVGLDMPKTTEEYEEVLMAFKEQDPNDNGKADEIPLSGAIWYPTSGNDVEDFLMSAFIYSDGNRFLTAENGTIIFTPNKPEWKDGLKYINRLYSKGLIDSEAFTNSIDTLRVLANKVDDPVLGAYAAGFSKAGAQEDGIWQLYRVVPPLKGPAGVQLTAYRPYMPQAGAFAITNKASDAVQKKAMELANHFYTLEGTLEAGAGLRGHIGESYEYKGRQIPYQWDYAGPDDYGKTGKPAIVVKLTPPPTDVLTNYKWGTGFRVWTKERFDGWAAAQDIMTNAGYERFLVVESDKYIDYVPDEVVPPSMYFDPEDAQLTAQLQVEIQNYVKQNTVAFISGQRSIDAEWDSYVNGFKGLRLDDYLRVLQKTYDKMK